jgi:tetratricopeptide (TPR) repeat protein
MITLVDVETGSSLVTFAEEARSGLTGLDGASVQTALEDRRPELLAALEWFVSHDRPEEAFRLASALVPFWMATKRIDEGDAWFERILSLSGGSRAARARALYEHGYLIFWAGDDERSSARQRDAVELGRLENDPTVIALALTALARIALRHDVDEARALLLEAIAVTDGTADRIGRSGAMHVLAVAEQMSGNLAEAARLMSERIEIGRETGNFATIAIESNNLSMVERQLGNLGRAEELSREALEIFRRRGDAIATAWALNGLAAVAAAQDQAERGAVLLAIADAALAEAGGEWPPDERVQHDETLARLSEQLGPEGFERAMSRGRAMTADEGVNFALTAKESS